jgi:hypothetical protein
VGAIQGGHFETFIDTDSFNHRCSEEMNEHMIANLSMCRKDFHNRTSSLQR